MNPVVAAGCICSASCQQHMTRTRTATKHKIGDVIKANSCPEASASSAADAAHNAPMIITRRALHAPAVLSPDGGGGFQCCSNDYMVSVVK